MTESKTPSTHPEVWSKEKCKTWLIAEKEKGTSYETFWDRLKEWHTKTYEGGNGNQAYADACLEIMDLTQREIFPEDARRGDAEFAHSLFHGKMVDSSRTDLRVPVSNISTDARGRARPT